MPLAIDYALFNVQDKSTRRFKHTKKLFAARQKPSDVLVRFDASISYFTAVGVRRRGNDQIKNIIWVLPENLQTIAFPEQRLNSVHVYVPPSVKSSTSQLCIKLSEKI